MVDYERGRLAYHDSHVRLIKRIHALLFIHDAITAAEMVDIIGFRLWPIYNNFNGLIVKVLLASLINGHLKWPTTKINKNLRCGVREADLPL